MTAGNHHEKRPVSQQDHLKQKNNRTDYNINVHQMVITHTIDKYTFLLVNLTLQNGSCLVIESMTMDEKLVT